MIVKPVLKRLRDAWPEPCIVLRGGRHFSNPKLMLLAPDNPDTDFIFGLTGNSVPAKRFLNAAIPTTKSSLSPQVGHLPFSDSQGGGDELG